MNIKGLSRSRTRAQTELDQLVAIETQIPELRTHGKPVRNKFQTFYDEYIFVFEYYPVKLGHKHNR